MSQGTPTMYESRTHTFAVIHETAKQALDQADSTGRGSFYNAMSTLVFSAFCLEAYLNHVGRRLFNDWDAKYERRSMRHKLALVCNHLKLDHTQPPCTALDELVTYRNTLAHGKTKPIKQASQHQPGSPELYKDLLTDWEKQTEIGNARRLFGEMEAIVTTIHKAAGMGDMPFLVYSSGGTA